MRDSAVHRIRAVVSAASLLLLTAGPAAADPSQPASAVDLRSAGATDAATRLGRAAREWRNGDLRAVVENLEGIDYSTPTFSEADRAAFLLGQAYLRLGERARFAALAASVSGWRQQSAYTRWLLFERAWREGGSADPAALAGLDTTTALGRDLMGVAAIGHATRALGRNEAPDPWLDLVPRGSRHAPTARHIRGLAALERGDTALAVATLGALIQEDSAYAARREAWLALAGLDLGRGDWATAHAGYSAIERDRQAAAARIQGLLQGGAFDTLWRAWESGAPGSDAWVLDAGAAGAASRRMADVSTDLRLRLDAGPPSLDVRIGVVAPAPPPSSAAWSEIEASTAALESAAAALERGRWSLARERERLASRRGYLEYGGRQVGAVSEDLVARAALLDSLRATVEELVKELRSVRDASTARIVRRATEVVAACERSILWIRAMAHFHLSGPERERPRPLPPAIPSRDVLLAEEEALARAVMALARDLAAQAPELIARSHDESWGPSLVNRMMAQTEEVHRSLALARSIAASVDSAHAASASSDSLRRLEAQVARLEREAAARQVAHQKLRDRVARETLKQALAALDREREAVEYGLAVASYGLGVGLATAVPEGGPRVVKRAEGDAAPNGNGESTEGPDDPAEASWRGQAIERHRAFLAAHPRSFARGEMRFRLADLLLMDARHRFREAMASYVRARSEGGNPRLPVLSHAPALALYRALLAEDHDFPHRDAALFNAGMILADGADPEAMRFFDELVTRHPNSRYAQESHLRMGDMDFDARRFPAAVGRYAKAAAGGDPNLRVIALYKMGWAHFNEDRFGEAADAFRAVLDLYASPERAAIEADIEKEAETYLVHSLAGSGGAEAVVAYFDRIGERTYERRVLMALGQHLRRAGRLAAAAGTDEMVLARYPEHPDALIAARRLIETRMRADDPARARAARLEQAERFAPGSRWAKAQDSDSLRAAGEAFARGAWETVADAHHRAARAKGAREDWKQALAIYENMLTHWPDGEAGATLRMRAGEASTALGAWAGALRHYDLAARAGNDSLAADALWQRVAVTDTWYGTTRPPGDRSATGSDSLARAVRAAAEALLARFPNHPRAANLAWRRGQLAYAHGWWTEAARDFEQLAERHPSDRRAPDAAVLRAEALYRTNDFEAAGSAWEAALALAQTAGRDSLARRARTAIPICAYRHAEAAVARDSTDYLRHAALFEKIATRWPGYEHAHAAQYRAGLAWIRAGRTAEGALAMQNLIERFPKSSYVRDAHLEIARAWEAGREPARAGDAYSRFAERYPDDPSAKDAWLKAADLYAAGGIEAKAEDLRLAYIRRYPGDFESAMEILEPLARRDLAAVGPGRTISSLLAKPATKKGAAAKAGVAAVLPSHLAAYLKQAEAHPELASRGVLAQVHFLQGEEAQAACAAAKLGLPLAPAIAAKQKLLNRAIAAYRKAVDVGVPEWAHAASFRMGEALVAFGQALERSQRPADLRGDDLLAYEEVLVQQGEVFAGRGETVWTDLLRQKRESASDDPWIQRAQSSLWKRLGNRFFYRPEVEHPVVAAEPAERRKAEEPAEKPRSERASRKRGEGTRAVAQREGNGR